MNNKTICRLVSLLMAIVMVLLDSVPIRAATSVAQTTGPTIYWGAMVAGKAPSSTNLAGVMNTFETRSKKKMSIIHWGQPWVLSSGGWGEFQTTNFDNVRNHGSIPMINWTSWKLGAGANQPDFQNRDVYGGKYDVYIRRWATAAKNWGHPFFLRFNHEPNGWWYPWGEGKTSSGVIVNGNSQGDFIKAWRHVHDIFVSVGATNVTWVWSMNNMGKTSQYPALATLYPGDAYVDWTGLTAYNKYRTWTGLKPLLVGGTGGTWLKDSYHELVNAAPNKPMMLCEFGSNEAGDGGAKKAAWIKDALTIQIPVTFPKLKAVVYMNWEANRGATYPIESSQAATDAWAAGIRAARYAKNTFANLNTSPIQPLSGSSTAAADAETLAQASEAVTMDAVAANEAQSFVERLNAAGITDGCPNCDGDVINRAQLAVLLERGMHGGSYLPLKVKGKTGFSDVPHNYWAVAWIKQAAADEIILACEEGNYCPELEVTRAELAVSLLLARHGAGYVPPEVGDGTGFSDVAPDDASAAWIKQLGVEGIAPDCGNNNFCPNDLLTLDQAAVFLVRTFNLP